MSAGITQLIAKGVQDSHLTGDPEISFFRSSYKRHTNFAMYTEEQQKIGAIGNDGLMTVRIERTGDLLQGLYVTKTASGSGDVFDQSGGVNQVTEFSNLFDHVDLMIGGQVVDTWWPDFGQYIAPQLTSTSQSQYNITDGSRAPFSHIPISFWFTGNPQGFLPLVALQYHDVELRIIFSSKVTTGAGGNINTSSGDNLHFWGKYISLDEEERKFMTEKSVNLLITQVQRQPASNEKIHEFNFTHPIKFLATKGSQASPAWGSNPGRNTSAYNSDTTTITLQVNGTALSRPMFSSPHLTQVTKYYNSRYGQLVPPGYGDGTEPVKVWTSDVFLYPFCLDTNSYQPTGTLNFSRVDNATFKVESGDNTFVDDLYGVNYNILRIQNGMGGLVYAN